MVQHGHETRSLGKLLGLKLRLTTRTSLTRLHLQVVAIQVAREVGDHVAQVLPRAIDSISFDLAPTVVPAEM